jgi:hypothetical protein
MVTLSPTLHFCRMAGRERSSEWKCLIVLSICSALSVGYVPLGAVRLWTADDGFAGGSCLAPMAAFWKLNSKVLPNRQQSFITVSILS